MALPNGLAGLVPAALLAGCLRRYPRAALLFAAGMLLGVGGCTNNPYPPGESARPVIYRTLGDDPKTLDPSVSYNAGEAAIVDLIYPCYFRYHYLKRDPFVLELALGAAEPVRAPLWVSPAGKTVPAGTPGARQGEQWTFRIKRGLRFQDDPCFPGGKGREITASDFLYSFRRMADPAVGCPVRSFFEDKILGFVDLVERDRKLQAHGKPADMAGAVAGLQTDASDPYTFRILLNQPYPQLRYLMTMHFTTPLAHEAVERYGAGLARHAVGCGAYLLASYVPKQRIVLKVNPNRWPEYYPTEGAPGDREAGLLRDAGKRLPLADTVIFSILREGITGWNLFLQGYEDSWGVTQTNYREVISQQGELSAGMVRRGVEMQRDISPNFSYFAFNMRDPLVGGYTPQKRKLRQAISTAIDAGAFIDLFSQGRGEAAQFILPPGIFGYDRAFRNPYRQADLRRAQQLLAEAGYPDGIDPSTGDRLTLCYDDAATTPADRQYTELLVKQLDALGVRVQTRSWRSAIWEDRVNRGEFQFVHWGWIADYPDPENFLFLLYGPNIRPGPNASAYDNPEYNRLFEQMRALDDGPQRLALIRRMRDIAVEDCPLVFMQHDEDLAIHYNWLKNVKPHPVAYDTAKYLAVDGRLRARMQARWNRPNYWPAVWAAVLLGLSALPAAAVVQRRRRRRVRRD